MQDFYPAQRALSSSRQRGMTLIELMVSMAIGLILMTGLVALFARQSTTQVELDKSNRQIQNGRYATQLLQEDLQLAGYYGEYSKSLPVPAALPDPCAVTVADLDEALALPVQGYDSPAALPVELTGGACKLDAANYLPGTDILVLRRVDTTCLKDPAIDPRCAPPTLKAGEIYLQSGLSPTLEFGKVLAAATSTAVDPAVFTLDDKAGNTAALRRYLVRIYFVSPCSVPTNGATCSAANTDDGGVSVPTLKRMELSVVGGELQFTVVPLVEGIENLQIDYGFDVAADDIDADGAPDSYKTKADAAPEWANVMAVRLNLLARNNERSAGYHDDKVYGLGLAGAAATDKAAAKDPNGTKITMPLKEDGFKRRVFSQLIRMVNPSSRRERAS